VYFFFWSPPPRFYSYFLCFPFAYRPEVFGTRDPLCVSGGKGSERHPRPPLPSPPGFCIFILRTVPPTPAAATAAAPAPAVACLGCHWCATAALYLGAAAAAATFLYAAVRASGDTTGGSSNGAGIGVGGEERGHGVRGRVGGPQGLDAAVLAMSDRAHSPAKGPSRSAAGSPPDPAGQGTPQGHHRQK